MAEITLRHLRRVLENQLVLIETLDAILAAKGSLLITQSEFQARMKLADALGRTQAVIEDLPR